MTNSHDQQLAKRVLEGSEAAFVTLIRRYERVLAGLIRSRIGSGEQVRDVMQETLVHAWSGLRRDTPRDVRPWLLQVARNRCRDYFRSPQRRELYVGSEVLTPLVNRSGLAQSREREAAMAILEAMDEVPERERAALRAFYVDGLSIAEIAARHRSPDGTVKRRLSHGRDRIRRAMGITPTRRKTDMKARQQDFPRHRPEIRIHPSAEKSLRVDFTEMAWWFVVPVVGDRTGWGMYDRMDDPDESWCLTETVWLTAHRPAVIHGRSCVEVEVEELTAEKTRPQRKYCITRVWGHLADDEVEWIAVESTKPDGVSELETFLDDRFHDDWWGSRRVVEDCKCLSERADGTWVRQPDTPAFTGAGVFDVHVGGRQFTCLRVIDLDQNATERDNLIEAYITPAGRTVLCRRYNGSRWGKKDAPPHNQGETMTWEEDLPENDRIVIDGVTYVHWYDRLSAAACGIDD
ncbi:MAG: sigma-70 family RNA polymerase sigma factor [Gemmatimonadota bacterium]|nr:sigma-70 family RNA polymerase sigma factor [Gemmatimonadota bacterium]